MSLKAVCVLKGDAGVSGHTCTSSRLATLSR
uniref:ATP:cob(I)alamin adenosyltransferase n=1 Tax=Macrostomum lignano TaxID=282301 RepID=A0A1I8F6B7_9PLAT